jgi:hypothetical protein
MPAQFEILHPDNTVTFETAMHAGEPLYIARDAAGKIVLTDSPAGELFALLIETSDGGVEVSALQAERVLLDGAPLQGTRQLQSWSEIRVDGYGFVFAADVSAQAVSAGSVATPARKTPEVRVQKVHQISSDDGIAFEVTVATTGSSANLEPKVQLHAELGRLRHGFIPVTESQRRHVALAFAPTDTLNMRHQDEATVELNVVLKPSSALPAGIYHVRVRAFPVQAPDAGDVPFDAPVEVQPFWKFHMGDPSPAQHSWPRFWPLPPARSVFTITNQGNVEAEYTVKVENAPYSDCRANLRLLPRAAVSDAEFADTSELEATSQPQQMQGLRIAPSETRAVQVALMPQGRPLISLKHPRHQVNVSLSADRATPISKDIRISTVPVLLGPLRMLLALLFVALVIVESVMAMNASTGFGLSANANVAKQECPNARGTQIVEADAQVAMTVCGAPFTNMKLEKLVFNATPEVMTIADSANIPFVVDRALMYRLTATHPLGLFLPWAPFVVSRSIDFGLSDGRAPTGFWDVKPASVPAGGEVVVFWDGINQAKRLTLYVNGVPNVISAENIPAGQMKFNLTQPAAFKLEAVSDAGVRAWLGETRAVTIEVPSVAPTALPPPVITRFDVSPSDVVSGQQVLLQWEVAGPPEAMTVTLVTNGVPAIVPAIAAIYQLPQSDANGLRVYELIVTNGTAFARAMKQVMVSVPTPTPMPTPGPVGKPNYDLACGGEGRASLRQLGEKWTWVCLDNPLSDIADAVCRKAYGQTAYAKAENVGDKNTWMCWR